MNDFLISFIVLFVVIKYNIGLSEHGIMPTQRIKTRSHRQMTDTLNKHSVPEKHNRTNKLWDSNERLDTRKNRGFISDIIYPETDYHIREYTRRGTKTEKCILNYCYEVDGYPKQKIRKLLNATGLTDRYASTESISLSNRFNGEEEEGLCHTKVHSVYPQKAKNTNQIEKIIVNVEEHKQGLVFETCQENTQCRFKDTFPTGYIASCKQKYVIRRLMVYSADDKILYDDFQIPSCCICTVKKT